MESFHQIIIKKNQNMDILDELSNQEKVKVKIIVPLKDKKNTDKNKNKRNVERTNSI